MFFYEVTYNIILQGKFNLLKLRQLFENHQHITGGWLKSRLGPNNGVFKYAFEKEVGIAEINVFALDTNQPDYTDRVLFMVPIATPPQFIDALIELFDELAGSFTFSVEAYEIRMSEGYSLGWYDVEDYARLRHDYREIHDIWRVRTGMPACKTSEMLLPRNCIHAQVRQRQRPVSIILCPRASEINLYQLGGFPNIEVRGAPVGKDDLYQAVEAIELEQCKLVGIREKRKTILPPPQGPETVREIIVEAVRLEIDGSEYDLEIRTPDGPGVWVEYEMAYGTTSQVAERILQCLIELATKLDWHIIEGLDFQKSAPLDLDTQKLVEFIAVPPKQFSDQ